MPRVVVEEEEEKEEGLGDPGRLRLRQGASLKPDEGCSPFSFFGLQSVNPWTARPCVCVFVCVCVRARVRREYREAVQGIGVTGVGSWV